jgi:hypothetical protein
MWPRQRIAAGNLLPLQNFTAVSGQARDLPQSYPQTGGKKTHHEIFFFASGPDAQNQVAQSCH